MRRLASSGRPCWPRPTPEAHTFFSPCIVSSGLQPLLTLADRERVRFSMAVVLAAVLCLALLARSVGWLSSLEPKPHAPPTTMEMRLVELAPPTPVAPAAPATHAQAAPPPRAPAKRASREAQAQQ